MTNTQHTPGPWRSHLNVVGSRHGYWEVRVGKGNVTIAKCGYDLTPVGLTKEAAEANARLIAAAPDLLVALRAIVEEGKERSPAIMTKAEVIALDAIAAATEPRATEGGFTQEGRAQ